MMTSKGIIIVRDGEEGTRAASTRSSLERGGKLPMLLTWRWEDLGSSPGVDILDLFSKAAILYCTIVTVIFYSKISSWALFKNRNSCKATIRK